MSTKGGHPWQRKRRARSASGMGGWTYEPWRGTFYPDGLAHKRELAFASRKLSRSRSTAPSTAAEARILREMARRDAGRFRLRAQGLALRHQPARAGRGRRSDRALLRQRDAGAEGQARPDQLAAHADQATRPRRLRGLPAPAAADPSTAARIRHALEVRHDSFRSPDFVALAREHGVAIVLAGDLRTPADRGFRRAFRLCASHGHIGGSSRSAMPSAELDRWADRAKRLRSGWDADATSTRPAVAGQDASLATSSSTSSAATRSAIRRRRMALIERLA